LKFEVSMPNIERGEFENISKNLEIFRSSSDLFCGIDL